MSLVHAREGMLTMLCASGTIQGFGGVHFQFQHCFICEKHLPELPMASNLACLNLISGELLDLVYDLDAKFMDLRTNLG